jgi:hypothetical protein
MIGERLRTARMPPPARRPRQVQGRGDVHLDRPKGDLSPFRLPTRWTARVRWSRLRTHRVLNREKSLAQAHEGLAA